MEGILKDPNILRPCIHPVKDQLVEFRLVFFYACAFTGLKKVKVSIDLQPFHGSPCKMVCRGSCSTHAYSLVLQGLKQVPGTLLKLDPSSRTFFKNLLHLVIDLFSTFR